jgi:hypothetical protein
MEIQGTEREYCQETINLYRGSMVNIAERLWYIRSKELWGGMWSSWEEFLEEVGMKKGTASKLCSLYERMVIELKFPSETLHIAPWTNLYTALPMMTNKENAELALAKAKVLTGSELSQECYEHRHGKECPHERTSLLRHCLDCRVYMKVYENITVQADARDS